MRHVRNPRPLANPGHQDTRATSEKIDAIESELSAEYGNTPWLPADTESPAGEPLPTLSACLDEAALLFTNDKAEAARDLLLRARACVGDEHERKQVWWMLFELALDQHQPAFFDKLALDYANTFETSPPQWQASFAPVAPDVSMPVVNFRGKLCSSSQPALEQLQQTGSRHREFYLEFGAIPDIDLEGCALLLNILTHWQQHGCHLHIASGDLLVEAIRPLIQAGRADGNDAGWRLLIELMRLMNRHEDYQQLCIDYSITYEVSPPATAQRSDQAALAPAFMLPHCIALPIDNLLQQMEQYARQCKTLILDGRHLSRVELSAAAPWLNGLQRVAAGKPVECRNIGFLVARLLKLVGGDSRLNLIHRKP